MDHGTDILDGHQNGHGWQGRRYHIANCNRHRLPKEHCVRDLHLSELAARPMVLNKLGRHVHLNCLRVFRRG